MAKRLYVGNLPFTYTSANLEALFASYGQIVSAQVIMDRMTNRSRGFGFIEFADDAAADRAVQEMNGRPIDGRALTVNEARERAPGGGGGGGGFGGGGGRGGFGGGPGGGGGGRGGFGGPGGGGRGPRGGGGDRFGGR